MINYIEGMITYREDDNKVVIENAGIGYEILADMDLYNSAADEVTAYVMMVPGEDEFRLYGFSTREKRRLFNLLRTVSGLGSKTAVRILSGVDSTELLHAITMEDTKFLVKLPGIGKKTAERMQLELKTKVAELIKESEDRAGETNGEKSATIKNLNVFSEALEALENLGYSSQESRKVLKDLMVQNEDYTVQKLIKEALKSFLERNK